MAVMSSSRLTFEDLAKWFHLPINEAAKELNACATVLKKACRRVGIKRWPHRKLKSLNHLIAGLEMNLRDNPANADRIIRELETMREQRREILTAAHHLADTTSVSTASEFGFDSSDHIRSGRRASWHFPASAHIPPQPQQYSKPAPSPTSLQRFHMTNPKAEEIPISSSYTIKKVDPVPITGNFFSSEPVSRSMFSGRRSSWHSSQMPRPVLNSDHMIRDTFSTAPEKLSPAQFKSLSSDLSKYATSERTSTTTTTTASRSEHHQEPISNKRVRLSTDSLTDLSSLAGQTANSGDSQTEQTAPSPKAQTTSNTSSTQPAGISFIDPILNQTHQPPSWQDTTNMTRAKKQVKTKSTPNNDSLFKRT